PLRRRRRRLGRPCRRRRRAPEQAARMRPNRAALHSGVSSRSKTMTNQQAIALNGRSNAATAGDDRRSAGRGNPAGNRRTGANQMTESESKASEMMNAAAAIAQKMLKDYDKNADPWLLVGYI